MKGRPTSGPLFEVPGLFSPRKEHATPDEQLAPALERLNSFKSQRAEAEVTRTGAETEARRARTRVVDEFLELLPEGGAARLREEAEAQLADARAEEERLQELVEVGTERCLVLVDEIHDRREEAAR